MSHLLSNFDSFYFHKIKKRERQGVTRKSYESLKETPNMCRLDRVWRENGEGRGKERCGTVRTDEARKLNEGVFTIMDKAKFNGGGR